MHKLLNIQMGDDRIPLYNSDASSIRHQSISGTNTLKNLWSNKCFRILTYSGIILTVILIVILLPISFHPVKYNQYAFKRYTITQNIDWTTVYTNGNWYWGVGYQTFVFPRPVIEVKLINLSIIPTSGLEFFLNATFYYRLNNTANALQSIFQNFGTTGYNDQVTKLVIGDIKNLAPSFSVDDYLSNRFYVQTELENAIRQTLASNNFILDQGMFLMLGMQFPDRVLFKYLQTAVQAQETITAQYEQNQTQIQQETQYMVNLYLNNASYVQQTTLAQVNNILVTANATAFNLIQEADGAGLQYFLSQIPVTNPADIQTIVEVMAYLSKKPQFAVGEFDFFVNSGFGSCMGC